jgi:hypothetical protein
MREQNPYTISTAGMDHRIQRYSVLGVIVLCTLLSGILADSLLGVWRINVGEPIPGGWRWLLGAPVQTFRTQTSALLVGVLLLGFSLGGVWFFLAAGFRWLRRRL